MMSINLNDIAVLNFEAFDYRCIISLIRKSDAINLMQIADLMKKVEHYEKKSENYKSTNIEKFLKHI